MNRLCALAIAISVVASVLVTLPHAAIAAPGDAIVPGAVWVDPTYKNIGLVWQVSGDVNLNSTMQLEFRPSGASTWQPAAMAVRAYPSLTVNAAELGLDQWGASAMFLEPGTDYELRATISGPDGGGQTQAVSATTRSLAEPDASGRQLSVVPGSGGGFGTTSDPFRGLQATADAAQPGDTFTVAAGTYAPFELTRSGSPGHPIAFQADGNVVVDGGGTTRGIVTIGTTAHNTSHIMIEGFVISDGQWGIDAQNTQDILIVGNTIQDVSYGMVNRRDGGTEARQTVCDNEITGRTTWPQASIPSERGIDLRGTGNVVCHNTVRYFGDCV